MNPCVYVCALCVCVSVCVYVCCYCGGDTAAAPPPPPPLRPPPSSFFSLISFPSPLLAVLLPSNRAVMQGGVVVGVLGGLCASLLTMLTPTLPTVGPVVIVGVGYITYLTAEGLHFSGIISILVAGMVMQVGKLGVYALTSHKRTNK